jgi:hypothetical protein
MARYSLTVLLISFLLGCGDESSGSPDQGFVYPDWGTQPKHDFGSPTYPDFGQPCTTGTANACSSCTDVCPGKDDQATIRSCENKTCGIKCRGDYYDVNENSTDGCEAKDDVNANHSESQALDLGMIDDCNAGKTVTGRLPSDNRAHEGDSSERKNGLPDYYKLVIDDTGGLTTWCAIEPYFRLDLGAMTGDIQIRMTVTYGCKNGTASFTPKSVTVSAGASGEIQIDDADDCDGSDDDLDLVIKVEKVSGQNHSGDEYTITFNA